MKKMRVALALLISAIMACFVQAANVAKVGNTEYATINEAIAAWTNGSTLTLLADVTLSKTIEINSNESRTLDLGTYTMTAAKNKDAIQYVVKGRTSLGVALEIKADANNPGGITASGKSIVVHTKPLMSAPSKDRPITRFYGGVFNASNIVKQSGSLGGAGYTGASAPSFYFYGGVFNGSISTNRSLNQFHGGTFNGKLQMSVDSSAYTLIAGGRFKYLSNLQGSELNSDKFTIGSEKGKYDRGIYVDKDGYYVITSAPITEVSAKYKAVKKESYNSNNYFCYSAAATYGMFYEVASKAGTGSNVTVYEQIVSTPKVEDIVKPDATDAEKSIVEEAVSEISANTAIKNFDVEVPNEVVSFEIELAAVEVETSAGEAEAIVTEVTFTVTPENAAGEKVSTPSESITFRLPVPFAWKGRAKVTHNGTALDGEYDIKEEEGAKYVEVTSATFSTFSIKEIPSVAQIGTTYYTTLDEAVAAANAITSEQVTITMLADAEFDGDDLYANLVLDLNGKTITATGSYVFWFEGGSLTVKDSSAEQTGMIDGSATVSNAFLLMGEESLTIESGKIHANNNVIYTYGSGVTVTINGGELKSYIDSGNIFYLVGANDKITVNGGTFIGNVNPYSAGLSIYGGQFTADVSAYCAGGYAMKLNAATGKYEVVQISASEAVAKLDGAYYLTLGAAMNAARPTDTIVVYLLQRIFIQYDIIVKIIVFCSQYI